MAKKTDVNFDVNAIAKVVKILKREIDEKLEMVKGFEVLMVAKGVSDGLASENGLVKKEINGNNEMLEIRKEALAQIGLDIIDERKKVEVAKAESFERIKEIASNENKRIQDVRANSEKIMQESQKEASDVARISKRTIKEAEQLTAEAVADRDKAVRAYNEFTEKFAGAK